MPFYAVRVGRQPGVYTQWSGDSQAEEQVKGFTGARYKKFLSSAEAEAWIAGDNGNASSSTAASSISKGKKRAMSSDVDEDGWDVVYSDGACKGNGQAGSVAGVGVWWGPDDPRNIAERCPGDQTNNRAELTAILRVLETIPPSTRPLMIKTDSQYSIQCFNDWIGGWIKRNWVASSGQPVKNAPLIRYIHAHLEARKRRGQEVKLVYVKGHSGDPGNDGADAQANIGATKPLTPERPWASLEADLRTRLEAEFNPPQQPILIDVANRDHQAASGQSPSKIRKTAMSEAIKAASSSSSRTAAPAPAPAPIPFYLTPQNVVKSSSITAPPPSTDELEQYAECLLDDDLAADLSD